MKVRFVPAVLGTGLAGLAAQAYAAVPAGVTSAIEDVGTDSTTVATAMIVVIAGLLVFAYIRKQMH